MARENLHLTPISPGNVQRWTKLKEGEQPQESPEAVNDPSVWGEPTDQSIRLRISDQRDR